MGDVRGVPWRDAARKTGFCWVLCAAVAALLSPFRDLEGGLPVAAPVVMVLTRWFWERHRYWGAGIVAALAGSLVVGILVDLTWPHLGKLYADALATAVGAAVSIVTFTAVSRLTAPPSGSEARHNPH
ncbi:hypothetical protein FRZ03_19870 [Streptomyces misionensis]|uniref:Uncharacterized protein n=1 Tax=Streptomyces misionensis TaxID=67331 RepID=A0A5C6JLX0_9ACTN|nr:hypothetical protein [Streptomyces misionensis]TWV42536.1 hypothetical protein FRZ03_19870 [Streptomyces misionensis]